MHLAYLRTSFYSTSTVKTTSSYFLFHSNSCASKSLETLVIQTVHNNQDCVNLSCNSGAARVWDTQIGPCATHETSRCGDQVTGNDFSKMVTDAPNWSNSLFFDTNRTLNPFYLFHLTRDHVDGPEQQIKGQIVSSRSRLPLILFPL